MATNKPEIEDKTESLEATVAAPGEGDDLEVEIVDDTPPKDRGRKPLGKEVADPTDDELDAYTRGVQQRIRDLTHARHDERREKERILRERDELERLASVALEENKRLRQTYNAGAEQFAATQNEAATAALEAAKAKLRKAHEDFDTEAIVEAQAELSRAAMRAEQAKNFKPTPLQEEKEVVQPRQAQQSSPEVDRKTLDWQAKNQWFGQTGFEEYTSFALGLHQRLVASGVDPRSDEYFAQIDARMKRAFPELTPGDDDADHGKPESAPQTKAKPPAVVAPVSRAPAGPGKVRLSTTQLALAKKFGLTPQQYAAQVLKLQQENA